MKMNIVYYLRRFLLIWDKQDFKKKKKHHTNSKSTNKKQTTHTKSSNYYSIFTWVILVSGTLQERSLSYPRYLIFISTDNKASRNQNHWIFQCNRELRGGGCFVFFKVGRHRVSIYLDRKCWISIVLNMPTDAAVKLSYLWNGLKGKTFGVCYLSKTGHSL